MNGDQAEEIQLGYPRYQIVKEDDLAVNIQSHVLDAGVEDVRTESDHYEVLCPLGEFDHLSQALEEAGIQPDSAEIAYLPNSTISVTDPVIARQVLRLINSLEELEDVQNVFSNYEIDDAILEEED